MSEGTTRFAEWAVVEIMGHQTYAGFVSEQTIGGCAFVRVDVPAVEPDPEDPDDKGQEAFSKLFGQGAIYCITPTSEALARAAARRSHQKPVNVWVPELYPPARFRAIRAVDPLADDAVDADANETEE